MIHSICAKSSLYSAQYTTRRWAKAPASNFSIRMDGYWVSKCCKAQLGQTHELQTHDVQIPNSLRPKVALQSKQIFLYLALKTLSLFLQKKKGLINSKSKSRDSQRQKSLLREYPKAAQIPHTLFCPSSQSSGPWKNPFS